MNPLPSWGLPPWAIRVSKSHVLVCLPSENTGFVPTNKWSYPLSKCLMYHCHRGLYFWWVPFVVGPLCQALAH